MDSSSGKLSPKGKSEGFGKRSIGKGSVGKKRGQLLGRNLFLDTEKLRENSFQVDVEDFKVTSGLMLSYTVYLIRWKFLPTGESCIIEHRYSDFLTLYQYLQKNYPNLQHADFPEKKRFVTISDRKLVSKERLAMFKVWVKIFEQHGELWRDSKVQRFFDLPIELKEANSHRSQKKDKEEEPAKKETAVTKVRKRPGHRRSGSEMTIPVSFEKAPEPRVGTAQYWDQGEEGEIRRSGSDMYISRLLLQDALHENNTYIERSNQELRKSSFGTTMETKSERDSLRNVSEKDNLRDSRKEISPVFARKGLEVVHVPRKKIEDERIRELKDFHIHALLGRGGYGSVFLATETSTGLVVAVKRMAKKSLARATKVDQVKMEVNVLKMARMKQNRWIVQLHYAFQDEHFLYLAMQFCPGGDLRHLMENCEFDEATTRLFAAEMCVCVHQLHAMGYVHRDLKPDNFLISQRGHLKLADFGLSVAGFQGPKVRTKSSASVYEGGIDKFSHILVYFPPSAGDVSGKNSPENFDRMVVLEETEELEDETENLRDEKGRLYQRVKVFVTDATTCSDVIDTIKLRLDIRKQFPYNLLELAYINDHLHERVVRPDELVEPLYSTFEEGKHKFVFRRIPQPIVGRKRAASNYSDARGLDIMAPLSGSKQKLYQVVGSPNYMAREILLGEGYDSVVDWWSVGCIVFEMLYEVSPFEGQTPDEVFAKILKTKTISFPDHVEVSDAGKNLIASFICDQKDRLGANGGLVEVQKHEWFESVKWNELQYSEPPFLPELESQLDTGYFPDATSDNVQKYYQSSSESSGSFSRSATFNTSADSLVLNNEFVWEDFSWSWFT